MIKSTDRLTTTDLDLLRLLPPSEFIGFYLQIAEESIAKSIDLRLRVDYPIPTGYFDAITKQQTANFFGVTTESIDAWVRQGMPIQRAGRRPGGVGRWRKSGFNLEDCAQWVASRKSFDSNASDELKDAELQLRAERAQAATLKRRQLEGALVDAAAYRDQMTTVVSSVRKAVERLQQKWGNEVIEDLNSVIDEIELSLFGGDCRSETATPP